MKKAKEQIQQEALSRAAGGIVMSNYPAIYQGFIAKGIAEADIKPRENVFTFNAWKALGRYVRKGEHGVKVCTYAPIEKKEIDPATRAERIVEGRRPWMATVFHISQTEAMKNAD
jgi:antirestriction protein ArdC